MAKFEVYQSGRKNEFRFRLKADNGQIILSSEGYTTKAACVNAINVCSTIIIVRGTNEPSYH